MGERSARGARLLFVLSDDFGELANAMYLVQDQEFTPTLLMPRRLFALHQGRLVVPSRSYATVADVLAAVDSEKPDIVFLFSGYLYVPNRILLTEDLEKLIQELHARGCRIVTSDPFLGLLAKLDDDTFANHPWNRMLTDMFARVFAILKPFPHLYLADPVGLATPTKVYFYNPHVVVPPSAIASFGQTIRQNLGTDPARKRWLFLLSHEEYGAQMQHDRNRFADLLTNMLRQTLQEGRQPVLVAPPACFATLRDRVREFDDWISLAFCPYDLFLALLYEAEYTFYWNAFSNSVLIRAVNRLPIFFFGQGHMVKAIQPFGDVGMEHYYLGAELPYLDPNRPLVASDLAERAVRQEQAFRVAVHRFQQSPTPEALVGKLLQLPAEGAGR
jgi:hypothetical protein